MGKWSPSEVNDGSITVQLARVASRPHNAIAIITLMRYCYTVPIIVQSKPQTFEVAG